ncbi:WecB/TagA/CpsF family glycosyltransferase [Hyphococcus flavus]|uniref:WecB/TagA/CpsF family glycosyltransferase n=1 Tax=Hyphococcus flavus TaxID=1866326 RepID=A0AAE9ZFR8_9PROT|nr:WecB/TagA/CpsF family glycosyltransferase [Hyphococcus flavus]WDI32103.1 WecB/TagA/CpsF family glycosyltransferase [Hyphococcus flavus]
MAEPLPEISDTNKYADAEKPEHGGAGVAALRRDDFDRDVWCLMGLPVDICNVDQAVAAIDAASRAKRKLSFVTPNVNWLIRARRSSAARQEILNADLSLVDGAPLVLMAKLLGVPVTSRVAGSDVFEAIRRRPPFAGRKTKVFFFGGRDGAAKAAVERVNKEESGIEAVGSLNPGHGNVDSMSADDIIETVNKAAPDFVVVALGAAKGQAWIERNREKLTAPVIAHLGAVVDFTSGGIARAPRWMQRAGLEWVWRIKEEPALWRRYFKDGLGLIGLMTTAMAPQFGRARGKGGQHAGAKAVNESAVTVVKLTGDLVHGGLRPVREAYRAAAATGRPVRLNMTEVSSFDRAFLGLTLMLEKHLGELPQAITLENAKPAQRAIFKANGMNYPVAPECAAESVNSATSRQAAV